MIYYFCAKEFGWTPSNVDKLSNKTIDILVSISKEINEKERSEIENAKSGSGSRSKRR